MYINLLIVRLVMDGIDIISAQYHVLRRIVASELFRILTERGISSELVKGAALRQVPTENIRMTNNNPYQIGQQIARSVYGGLGGQRHE